MCVSSYNNYSDPQKIAVRRSHPGPPRVKQLNKLQGSLCISPRAENCLKSDGLNCQPTGYAWRIQHQRMCSVAQLPSFGLAAEPGNGDKAHRDTARTRPPSDHGATSGWLVVQGCNKVILPSFT